LILKHKYPEIIIGIIIHIVDPYIHIIKLANKLNTLTKKPPIVKPIA
jgi:hypothetical protein